MNGRENWTQWLESAKAMSGRELWLAFTQKDHALYIANPPFFCNLVKWVRLLWRVMGIDLLFETASNGHSWNCSFWHFGVNVSFLSLPSIHVRGFSHLFSDAQDSTLALPLKSQITKAHTLRIVFQCTRAPLLWLIYIQVHLVNSQIYISVKGKSKDTSQVLCLLFERTNSNFQCIL